MLVMIEASQCETDFASYQTSVSKTSSVDLATRLGYGRATIAVVLAS